MRERHEIEEHYKWDLESVFPTKDDYENEFAQAAPLAEALAAMKGQLNSPDQLAETFRMEDELNRLLYRLHLYAHTIEDQDTRDSDNQARMGRLRAFLAELSGKLAWIEPEILAHDLDTLKSWGDSEALKPYRRTMELLIRRKPHTLSEQEETLLGLASDILSNSGEAFSKFTNADLEFDSVTDSQGNTHKVTNGSFYSLLQSSERPLRKSAWESIYKGYIDHQNLLATLLAGAAKRDVFAARVRKHPSALEASLFNDNVPLSVYESLISAVHDALPIFFEYLDLRARTLELKDLNMWDLYTPLVPEIDLKISWEECREWIIESTKPLGEEYSEGVRQSFEGRWYDVYENKGKRSGAYSTHAYGEKPFMLLNYHGTLNDVFTVAHELGHSMHSWLSMRNQPSRYADYPIFLAEIASTTNEMLLHHYLMETKSDPKFRAYLLNNLCDSFRGTVYRQTMFAEFEWEIHKRLEGGEPLTSQSLNEYYFGLNAQYHGEAIEADKRIANEWSRIPHFYYNFYVYKYATGFSAAQVFYQQILESEAGRDRYLGFLKSGCIKDPLDTTKEAGVDLTNPQVLSQGFENFRQCVRQLSELLDEIK